MTRCGGQPERKDQGARSLPPAKHTCAGADRVGESALTNPEGAMLDALVGLKPGQESSCLLILG
jgi:hypothetical protein